ncbi:MAG TPA: uracil-DNA glycosylase [Candidatus Paceibacterota bacterium]|nr:uracil-DNA glycosylase [Candidatus Paceibacterota bacterium]
MKDLTCKKTELMKEVRDEILAFKKSPLYKHRIENNYFPVIGEGSYDASIVFIGEAPGKNEALTAKPFCGASGRILDELLAPIGMDRTKIYVTNIVKDRPPENRDPTPREIALYSPFLDRQIEIIQPKVIVTLGRFSMLHIMNSYGVPIEPISKAHGKKFVARAPHGEVDFIPLYHPAMALYNPNLKKTLIEDAKILIEYI